MNLKLDIVSGWVCPKGSGLHIVKGSGDKEYSVFLYWEERSIDSCSCPAYRFSKEMPQTCKHIESLKETEVCGWNSVYFGGEPVIKDGVETCPECGTELTSARFGV